MQLTWCRVRNDCMERSSRMPQEQMVRPTWNILPADVWRQAVSRGHSGWRYGPRRLRVNDDKRRNNTHLQNYGFFALFPFRPLADSPRFFSSWLFRPLTGFSPGLFSLWLVRPLTCSPFGWFAPSTWTIRPLLSNILVQCILKFLSVPML